MNKKPSAVLLAIMLVFAFQLSGCAQINSQTNKITTPASQSINLMPEESNAEPTPNTSEAPGPDASKASQSNEITEVSAFKGETLKSPAKISADMPDVQFSQEKHSFTAKDAYEDNTYIFMHGPAYPYYAIDRKTGKAINLASGPKIIGYNHNLYSFNVKEKNNAITKTDVATGKITVLADLGSQNIESFFIYDDKLYFSLSREDAKTYDLYSMNLDGTGKEKLIGDAQYAVICNEKIYYYNDKDTAQLFEAGLATNHIRIFNLPADKYYIDAFDLNKLPYLKSDKSLIGVLDTGTGKITNMLEPFYDYASFGQYLIFTVKPKPDSFALKAFDVTSGKVYYASDFAPINEALVKYKNAQLGGFRSSGNNLYFLIFTSRLHIYRIDIKGGKCSLTEVTK